VSLLLLLLLHLLVLAGSAQTWQQVGPFTAPLTTIEPAAYDSTVLFANTNGVGLFRFSMDTGTWSACRDGLPDAPPDSFLYTSLPSGGYWGGVAEIRDFVTHPEVPGEMWAATEAGLYRSTNEGDTWSEVTDLNLGGVNCYAVEWVHSDPDVLVIIVSFSEESPYLKDIYRSTDGGLNWVEVEEEVPYGWLYQTPAPEYKLVCGPLVSIDGGATWAEELEFRVGEPPFDAEVYPTRFRTNPTNPQDVWALADGWGWTQSLIHSVDGGQEWEAVENYVSRTSWFLSFAQTGSFAFNEFGQVYIMRDGGTTRDSLPWNQDPDVPSDYYEMNHDATFPGVGEDTVLFVGDYGMLWSNDGGLSVQLWNDGLDASSIRSVIRGDQDELFACGLGGLFHTTDSGENWEQLSDRAVYDIAYGVDTIPFLLVHTTLKLWRYNLDSASWDLLLDGTDGVPAINQDYPRKYYYYNSGGILFSGNAGVSWSVLLDEPWCYDFTIDPIHTGRFYAACNPGNGVHRFFRSIDSGENWSEMPSPPDGLIDILAGFEDENLLYANSFSSVFRSDNGGESWSELPGPFPNLYSNGVHELRHSPFGDEAVFLVVQGDGVFHRTGPNEPWVFVEGPYDRRVNDLLLANEYTLYLGTNTSGVMRCDDFYVGVIEASLPAQPSTPTLDSLYPNPFNASLTITYQVPEKGHVELILYNLLGQRVQTLVNQLQTPGNYRLQWPTTASERLHLSSGCYLVRIRTGGVVDTRRVVLVN